MPRLLLWLLVIVSAFPIACGAKQTGTPSSRAARAAAREWLQRNPQFAAKTGKEPGSTMVKDHDHAIVLVSSWPPGALQGVIRLTRVDGIWQVASATTRPQPRLENMIAVMFRFDYTHDDRAEHVQLHRCTRATDQREVTGVLTPDEIARARQIIASRQYYPTPEARHQKAYDSIIFDKAARQFLLD
jgi:hypothetical protein